MDILMGEDVTSINSHKNAAEYLLEYLRELNNTFKALGDEYKQGLKAEELRDSIENESFLVDKIIGNVKNPTIGGIKVSLVKLREMIELPDGATDFNDKANQIKAIFRGYDWRRGYFNWSFYKIEKSEVI